MSGKPEQIAALKATPIQPRPPLARLGFVDGLRALAALYVVIHHIGLTVWWQTPVPAGMRRSFLGELVAAFSFGHYAVSVFIVLSGYSLTLQVARHGFHLPDGALGFYWRRARRILPPYYAAMIFCLLLIWSLVGHATGTLWDITLPITWAGLIQHLLLVNDITSNGQINYVFWSIALECQIYLLFPALVWLWRRYHPLFAMIIVTVLAFTLAVALIPTWVGRIPNYGFAAVAPQYIGLFGMGMFAAAAQASSTPLWARLARWRVWDAISVGGVATMLVTMNERYVLPMDLLTGLVSMSVLLASLRLGTARSNPIRAILEWRPLVWIGGFSYSLYLIHAPLIQVLWQYVFHPLGLGDTVTYLLLLLLGGPLIVLAAWGFWYVCERPFLNSRPQVTQVQRRAKAGDGAASVAGVAE